MGGNQRRVESGSLWIKRRCRPGGSGVGRRRRRRRRSCLPSLPLIRRTGAADRTGAAAFRAPGGKAPRRAAPLPSPPALPLCLVTAGAPEGGAAAAGGPSRSPRPPRAPPRPAPAQAPGASRGRPNSAGRAKAPAGAA